MERELRFLLSKDDFYKLIEKCEFSQKYKDRILPISWDTNGTDKWCTSFARLRTVTKDDHTFNLFTYKAGNGIERVEIEKKLENIEFNKIFDTFDNSFLVRQEKYIIPNTKLEVKLIEIYDDDEESILDSFCCIEYEFEENEIIDSYVVTKILSDNNINIELKEAAGKDQEIVSKWYSAVKIKYPDFDKE